MRKKFVFATNNSHKLEEVTAILGEKVELLSMILTFRKLQTHLKEMLC